MSAEGTSGQPNAAEANIAALVLAMNSWSMLCSPMRISSVSENFC
jgi:hypothetical protein